MTEDNEQVNNSNPFPLGGIVQLLKETHRTKEYIAWRMKLPLSDVDTCFSRIGSLHKINECKSITGEIAYYISREPQIVEAVVAHELENPYARDVLRYILHGHDTYRAIKWQFKFHGFSISKMVERLVLTGCLIPKDGRFSVSFIAAKILEQLPEENS